MSNVTLKPRIDDQIGINHELLLQNLNNTPFFIKTIQDEIQNSPTNESVTIKFLSVNSLDTIVDLVDHFVPIAINNQLELRVEHPELAVLEQIYKSLRTSLANGVDIQNSVLTNVRLMSHTRDLLTYLLDFDEVVSDASLCLVLQFLCNLVVMNKKAQVWVWGYFKIGVLKSLLRIKVAHVSVMIIYNICKANENLLPRDTEFVHTIITLMSKDIENIEYLLELLFAKNVIADKYQDLDTETRILLLDNLYNLNKYGTPLPLDLVLLFVHHFKKKSDCILKTVDHYINKIDPLEVSQLLELIASVAHKHDVAIQADKSLLINVVYLLKSMHDFGKVGGNNFSAIKKLSELTNRDTELQDHPAFGFKASLIRLIGTFASGHKANQDLIRELDCIPLLMDCCNMDARNPLIMQWVVFAVRLLCDGNITNQKVIAKMTKVGVVDSELIREMGMMLNEHGRHKIGIAPLYYPE